MTDDRLGTADAPLITFHQSPITSHALLFPPLSPPAATITPMITRPVTTWRIPALTPNVLSIVSKRTRKRPAPQRPATKTSPPATDRPPNTTNAIQADQETSTTP